MAVFISYAKLRKFPVMSKAPASKLPKLPILKVTYNTFYTDTYVRGRVFRQYPSLNALQPKERL